SIEEFVSAHSGEFRRQVVEGRAVDRSTGKRVAALFRRTAVHTYAEPQFVEPAEFEVIVGVGRPGQGIAAVAGPVGKRPVQEIVGPVRRVRRRIAGTVW